MQFQFHTGSIKRFEHTNGTDTSHLLFQFHTGSIKSVGQVIGQFQLIEPCFNSILVRLKDCAGVVRLSARVFCFNSILVRLKVASSGVGSPAATVSIPYWFD